MQNNDSTIEDYGCPPGLEMPETIEELRRMLHEAEEELRNGKVVSEEEHMAELEQWRQAALKKIAAQKSVKEAVVV